MSLGPYRVWAPVPASVELQVDSKRLPMKRNEHGWWVSEIPQAAGARYQFIVDGQAVPDPRSPFQPEGVHGPSQVVDHGAHKWTDSRWQAQPLASALIYELHVGTFTAEGTFDAVVGKLDHLIDLGVTHVELMPVVEFPGERGWGYDGVDLYAPHHAYGGPNALKRLINTCHERGLAVLLDVVYNHLGPAGNYLARFAPYFSKRCATPWGPAVNLDQAGSDEVRRFLCDNALMWLREYHFDGLRLDAVHAFVDTSATHFLHQLSTEVDALEAQLGRHLTLIAESDMNDPRIVRPREAGGYGLDAQWSDDFHHALHAVLTGESKGYYEDFGSVEQLAYALAHAYVYDGRYSTFRGRRHGVSAGDLPGWKFLGYSQTHDQIGNRAIGDRSSHLLSPEKLKIAAALVLTSAFVPMLFQGEDWGASTPFLYFASHEDEALARSVSEGRRREFIEFGWSPEAVPDPQSPETFHRSKLRWKEIDRQPHSSLFDWHKHLAQLRRARPELSDGRLDRVLTSFDDDSRWLLVRRGAVAIACNFGDTETFVPLPGAKNILMESKPVRMSADSVQLAPASVAILDCEITENAKNDTAR